MSFPGRPRTVAVLVLALLIVFYGHAEAYVDPGTGSMLVQLILGGVMAAIVMIRTWWHRIRAWLPRRSGRDYAAEK